MAYFPENLGLGLLSKSKGNFERFIARIAAEGTPVTGYYGRPYINRFYGDAQLILRTRMNVAGTQVEITGVDTHCAGRCLWDVLPSDIGIASKHADATARRLAVKPADGGKGVAVVDIVNADVLPSFLDDDVLTLQMTGFPLAIDYYADEAAYAANWTGRGDGGRWRLSDGAILPAAFLRGQAPEYAGGASEGRVLIRGTVKGVEQCALPEGIGPGGAFVRATIGTRFGDLELVHTAAQVSPPGRKHMRAGATVSGAFVLSGNAAVGEYAGGVVRDARHNLRLLRHAVASGEVGRLRYALDRAAVCTSEIAEDTAVGREAVIRRLRQAYGGGRHVVAARLARVFAGEKESPGPGRVADGTGCVVWDAVDGDRGAAIAFSQTNADGLIVRIDIRRAGRYRYV